MQRQQVFDWAVRLVLAYAGMLFLAGLLGQFYGESLLPLFRGMIRLICPDFWIMGFDLIEDRGEFRFALVAISVRDQLIGNAIIPAGAVVSGSTLLGHSLQHPVLMFSLLLAWPRVPALRRFALCCLALPFLLLVECLDVPVVLGGNVLASMAEQVAPALLARSLLVHWIDFLGGGGRIVISLLAAGGALLLFRFIETKLLPASRGISPYTLAAGPR